MYRIVVITALAAIVAGCGAAPARPDAGPAATGVPTESTAPADAVAVAEASPKKPKFSCVQ
jgi:PBP1b-binding outer membrane lipoprotein LpoB